MYAPPDAHFLACGALQWTVKMPVETADTEHGTALLRAPQKKNCTRRQWDDRSTCCTCECVARALCNCVHCTTVQNKRRCTACCKEDCHAGHGGKMLGRVVISNSNARSGKVKMICDGTMKRESCLCVCVCVEGAH